jgi:glucose/mannose-6-phosphate isomerase
MYSVDKSDFKRFLKGFHTQIKESSNIVNEANITIDASRINNLLYIGMGGSAIAGDLIKDILFDNLKVPTNVVRGYLSPAYCGDNTLVLATSYSGNTEETLSAISESAKTNAQIVVVTSGGKLKEMAEKNGWGIIILPEGYQPRQALGYIFFTLYHTLGNAGLLSYYEKSLNYLVDVAKHWEKANDYPNSTSSVLPFDMANKINGKIPIIYSSAPLLRTVGVRWRNQFNENSKSMAFSNAFPELNHNEIVGWECNSNLSKDFIVIFLENEDPHPRIKKRIDITKKLINDKGVEVIDIYSAGKTPLEKVFSLIVLGDWVTYYLALTYKKDPIEINNINYLKEELAKN